jgi:hypothetical protein
MTDDCSKEDLRFSLGRDETESQQHRVVFFQD